MNEQLLEQGQLAIINLLNKAVQGVDFAVEQAPDVVQQLLQYKFYQSLIYFIIAMCIFIGIVATINKTYVWAKEETCSTVDALFYTFLLYILPVVLSSILIDFTWLKIWFAPKLYILEYAADLVK